MEHTWIANSNDYSTILKSLSVNVLIKIAKDLQDSDIRDTPLFKRTCCLFNQFMIDNRPIVLTAALTKQSRIYIKACPCHRCRYNEPCIKCGIRIPFDITTKEQKFTFTLCRGELKHVCIKCYITYDI